MKEYRADDLYETDEDTVNYEDVLDEVRDLRKELHSERTDERDGDVGKRRKNRKRLNRLENKLSKIEAKLNRLEKRQVQKPKPRWWQKGLFRIVPSVLGFAGLLINKLSRRNDSQYQLPLKNTSQYRVPMKHTSQYQLPLKNNPTIIDLNYDEETDTYR